LILPIGQLKEEYGPIAAIAFWRECCDDAPQIAPQKKNKYSSENNKQKNRT